jgi:nitrogen fixation protein FixH
MTCDTCGVELHVGDYPFCPHGRGSNTVVPDDVPGGFVVENGFETPRKFYSRSEHEKALAAEGLEIRAKWAGEHDRHLTRWDTVDLESAAVLVTRGVQARREKARRWADASIPITVSDGETFTGKDL